MGGGEIYSFFDISIICTQLRDIIDNLGRLKVDEFAVLLIVHVYLQLSQTCVVIIPVK